MGGWDEGPTFIKPFFFSVIITNCIKLNYMGGTQFTLMLKKDEEETSFQSSVIDANNTKNHYNIYSYYSHHHYG